MPTLEPKTLTELKELLKKKEALIFIGCGGELMDWVNGITKQLVEDEVYPEVPTWYSFEANLKGVDKPLTMLAMPLDASDVGRLCIWRLAFGDCSWWSDFTRNYKPTAVKVNREKV